MNPIIKACVRLRADRLSVTTVSVHVLSGGKLGVTIDYMNGKWDQPPFERFEVAGNEEQAEAMIHDVARFGRAHDVRRCEDKLGVWFVTKPERWTCPPD